MLRTSASLVAACLALGACTSAKVGEGAEQSFTVAAGPAKLGSEGWEDYDDRPQISLGYSIRKPDMPVGFEMSLQGGRSEAKTDPEEKNADFVDGRFGVDREFEFFDRLRLVIGG
jgi:hypothetical protein